jgi:hypothetical protein
MLDYHYLPRDLTAATRKRVANSEFVRICDFKLARKAYKTPQETNDDKTISLAPTRDPSPYLASAGQYADAYFLWEQSHTAMFPHDGQLGKEHRLYMHKILHEFDTITPLGVALIDEAVRSFIIKNDLAPWPISPSLNQDLAAVRSAHPKLDGPPLCRHCLQPGHFAAECPSTSGMTAPPVTSRRIPKKASVAANPTPVRVSRPLSVAPSPAVDFCKNFHNGKPCHLPTGKKVCT